MRNPHKDRRGLRRLWHATGHSIAGLRAAYRGEQAFRQEVWLGALLAPLGLWLGHDWVETTLLLGSLALLMIVELLNSAVEAVVDRVSLEWHELSKRAKDIGSAAVLLALLLCSGVWLSALWRHAMAAA